MAQLEELCCCPTCGPTRNSTASSGSPGSSGSIPDLANEALRFLFTVDGRVPPPMLKKLLGIVKSKCRYGQLAKDAWKGYRSL